MKRGYKQMTLKRKNKIRTDKEKYFRSIFPIIFQASNSDNQLISNSKIDYKAKFETKLFHQNALNAIKDDKYRLESSIILTTIEDEIKSAFILRVSTSQTKIANAIEFNKINEELVNLEKLNEIYCSITRY